MHLDSRWTAVYDLMDTLAGKHLVILGLARQGKALARFAVAAGATVTISDLRPAELLQAELAELADIKVETVLGEHPLNLLDGADVLALSGGVPADAPLVQEAQRRGIVITNDSQEFTRRCPAVQIGITGSAGKTTTTALTGEICRAAGRRTWVGGNIGHPLLYDLPQMRPEDIVVQELSSFQLEIWTQSPQVAAVLNVTPNHLDRHKTMTAYSDAKANILRYQGPGSVAVLCADDPGALQMRELAPGRVRLFSRRAPVSDGAYLADGQLWLAEPQQEARPVCTTSEVQLRGEHNLLNALAAITLADSVGVPTPAARQAIRSFTGVEHRLEVVATVNGVQYVNDSIATAPERVLAALNAFTEPLILLAGGRDKDLDWQEWAQVVPQRAKGVVLFGQLAPLLASLLREQGYRPVVQVETLAQAVQAAAEMSRPGDVVLLAPGGTSYDAYVDFAARGAEFRQLVQAQIAAEGDEE